MTLDLIAYLKTRPTVAVIGASNNKSKFGNIILRDLQGKGFLTVPVNPSCSDVEGLKSYPDLISAQKENSLGLLVYVIPPVKTLSSLKEAARLNLKTVWIQPGAGDDSVREFLDSENFAYLMNACVMVEVP